MNQLPLITAEAGTSPASPALRPATIRALRACNVLYLRTEWSAWFGDWQHRLVWTNERGVEHQLVKNDAGIAAMLGVRTHAAEGSITSEIR